MPGGSGAKYRGPDPVCFARLSWPGRGSSRFNSSRTAQLSSAQQARLGSAQPGWARSDRGSMFPGWVGSVLSDRVQDRTGRNQGGRCRLAFWVGAVPMPVLVWVRVSILVPVPVSVWLWMEVPIPVQCWCVCECTYGSVNTVLV